MIFETHAHYDDKAFDKDRDSVLKLLKKEKIEPVINVSSSTDSINRTLRLAHEYDHVYAALGIHPSDCGDITDDDIVRIGNLLDDVKAVAVGEIGLDYHYDEPGRDIQKKWFVRQLELAIEKSLPVIIHSRDAARDTFDILSEERFAPLKGIVHCYSYSLEMAREYVKMGYYIGVGGVVTFRNGRKLHEVVREIPIEKLVIETDSPYLAPVPYRGHRNSSVYLTYIIEEIASLKSMTYEEVELRTYENAAGLFGVRADG